MSGAPSRRAGQSVAPLAWDGGRGLLRPARAPATLGRAAGSVGLTAGRLRPAARYGIPPALAALRRVHPRHPAGPPRRALGGWPRGRGVRCPLGCGPPCVGGGPLLAPPGRRAQPVPGWCPPAAPYRAAPQRDGPPRRLPAGGARAAAGGPLGALRPPGFKGFRITPTAQKPRHGPKNAIHSAYQTIPLAVAGQCHPRPVASRVRPGRCVGCGP